MHRGRLLRSGVALVGILGLLAGCASNSKSAGGANTLEGGVKIPTAATTTATTVNVVLGDSGAGGGPMTLTLSPASVPVGDVTFVVKNNGSMVHEAVVLKTDLAFDKLPITYGGDPPVPVAKGANKVSEDANVGETGDPDLEPGGTRTFTIKHMAVGSYVVVCNIAFHYGKGMRAAFTVTDPARTVDVALGDSGAGGGPMTLTLSPASVPVGDVTFVVKNNGSMVHEAVVLKTDLAFDKLPITYGGDPPVPVAKGANKVSEDANVGETGDPDLEPGGTRTFTIKHMAVGNYVVVCNIAGHYAKGMRAALKVTNPVSTVDVALGDSGAGGGPMTLTLSPATVPVGDVTFVVKNNGSMVHEAVVLKTDLAFDKLPITYGGDPPVPVAKGANKVSEDANVGETGDPDLVPGGTRTFTIKHMAVGSYVVVCNIAGHYAKGMRAALTVTDPARTVNVTLGDAGAAGAMTLTMSPATVPAGDVTFVVKNDGTIVHEAVVLKTDVAFDKLPITYGGDPPAPVAKGANKVSEDANVGETGDPDLEPGGTRTFTIKHMAAGNYVVVCNIALHYGKGMRAPLKVG